MDPLVVVVMGSRSDLGHARQIRSALAEFDLPCEFRIASAHKSADHLLRLLAEYESQDRPLVYIAVAGRSNALGGLVDAHTAWPVINCPPYSDRFGGADIFSSLRMPSGVACLTTPPFTESRDRWGAYGHGAHCSAPVRGSPCRDAHEPGETLAGASVVGLPYRAPLASPSYVRSACRYSWSSPGRRTPSLRFSSCFIRRMR